VDYKTFISKQVLPLLILAVFITACGAPSTSLRGTTYPSITPASEIELTNQNGQIFQLSSTRGKVALVFFGFTHCVAECPAAMAVIRKALETADLTTNDVVVVMVSTDPDRDTPASMQEFLGRFNPSFVGLLGKASDLTKSWRDYGVAVQDGGETHSSFTYVIDKAGNLRETFSPDTSPDDIAADLKILLAE